MPPITALLHTKNDALRLGRALEMLLPCSEILIVDHHSTDATSRIARAYGARVVEADSQAPAHHYLHLAGHDWILCREPRSPSTKLCKRAYMNGACSRTTELWAAPPTGQPFLYSCESRPGSYGWILPRRKLASSPVVGRDGTDASRPTNLPPSRSKGSCCVLPCPDNKFSF